jgi:hypothetical protein
MHNTLGEIKEKLALKYPNIIYLGDDVKIHEDCATKILGNDCKKKIISEGNKFYFLS